MDTIHEAQDITGRLNNPIYFYVEMNILYYLGNRNAIKNKGAIYQLPPVL